MEPPSSVSFLSAAAATVSIVSWTIRLASSRTRAARRPECCHKRNGRPAAVLRHPRTENRPSSLGPAHNADGHGATPREGPSRVTATGQKLHPSASAPGIAVGRVTRLVAGRGGSRARPRPPGRPAGVGALLAAPCGWLRPAACCPLLAPSGKRAVGAGLVAPRALAGILLFPG